ncbi:hypothetical protein AAV94_01405 [Lampropedia cohaerens]|uniref:N-acetyltransferase domain-containing protein n=1 Tax=Lampropedia cohaerens TaxID=1610491 RepID=A0A0U1Q2W8_9BURK|nr:GNAT family N-acetyltransferase [Lampropedia cohaerens]KKW69086.1 hypothetical protein AAV94_01405 [Lampropedia cohaerens]
MPTIRKNASASRYEIHLDDGTLAGFADYRISGSRVELPHTVVEPQYSGQGLAAQLVEYALADIQAGGQCVMPTCSYVAAFIARKSQWKALVCQD